MTIARRSEWMLAGVLALEFIVFSAAAPNFATAGNAAEIVRLAVEIGLLALALTPIVDCRRHRPLVGSAAGARGDRARRAVA